MKFGKRLMSLALALVMIFGLTVNASAAVSQNVTAKLSPDIRVTLDGETQAMADANGNPVYPVLYNGTTYLPVRAIGNMMRLEVAWSPIDRTVMLFGHVAHTDASDKANSGTVPGAKPADITAQIDPGVIVEYDGKAQKMTDANGNTVYPILYNGTTYLPVRAVSDMLSIDVTWNQNTRTVALVKAPKPTDDPSSYFDFGNGVKAKSMSDKVRVVYRNGEAEFFGFNQIDDLRAALKKEGCSESLIDEAIEIFTDGGALIPSPEPVASPFKDFHTSSGNGIETISSTCIACEWGKLDWSNANDGYVTVTVNKLAGPTTCIMASLSWANERGGSERTESCHLGQGEYRIPLQGDSTEYVVRLEYATHACEHTRTADESAALDKFSGTELVAKFNAEIDNPGATWLASTPHADYENAPKTQAKARELTKNCKTDAEKVTAIFNWVADNIKYDKQLSAALDAAEIPAGKSCHSNPNGQHRTLDPDYALDYYDLDKIFTSKSGVCTHYAVLTVGMLRSVGIPCRAVGGEVHINGKQSGHAWIEISPDVKGLNKTALKAGAGRDGWTRLDPTFAASGGMANDDDYHPFRFYF